MNHARALLLRLNPVLLGLATASCSAGYQEAGDMAAQAQQLLEAGQAAQAQELIGRAVRSRDDMPAAYLVQARVALALGKRADAYQAFSNALALDATSPEALMGVAQTGLGTGHLEEAEKAADQILILDPNQTNAMTVKGIVKMVRNDLNGSVEYADKILSLKPGDMTAIILKSRVLALQGNRSPALAMVQDGIARLGPTLELTMALAELQRQGGSAEAFLSSLRQIEELAPSNRDYRFDMVDTLYRLGRIGEARAKTAGLIAEPPADSREVGRYARLWYAYDRDALTLDQLAQAAAKATVETRLALARFYMATGRGGTAAALLRPVATGWSSDIQAAYARAAIAAGAGTEARKAAADILQRDPGNGDALLVQAESLLAQGNRAGAINAYQRVVRDFPEWEEGHLGLARTYEESERPDGVRRALEDGRRALPQSLLLAREYVATMLRLGDHAQAQGTARRFALSSPSLVAAWSFYAAICARTGSGDCREEAALGLQRARSQFGLDPLPGTPSPVALTGRLN